MEADAMEAWAMTDGLPIVNPDIATDLRVLDR